MVLSEYVGNRNIVSKSPLKMKPCLNKTKIKRLEFIDNHNFEIDIDKKLKKPVFKVVKK